MGFLNPERYVTESITTIIREETQRHRNNAKMAIDESCRRILASDEWMKVQVELLRSNVTHWVYTERHALNQQVSRNGVNGHHEPNLNTVYGACETNGVPSRPPPSARPSPELGRACRAQVDYYSLTYATQKGPAKRLGDLLGKELLGCVDIIMAIEKGCSVKRRVLEYCITHNLVKPNQKVRDAVSLDVITMLFEGFNVTPEDNGKPKKRKRVKAM